MCRNYYQHENLIKRESVWEGFTFSILLIKTLRRRISFPYSGSLYYKIQYAIFLQSQVQVFPLRKDYFVIFKVILMEYSEKPLHFSWLHTLLAELNIIQVTDLR